MSATTTAHIISYDPAAIQRWEALGTRMATAEPRQPRLPQHLSPQAQQLRPHHAKGSGRKWWQYRWFDSEEHEVMKQQQAFALALYLTTSPNQAERES